MNSAKKGKAGEEQIHWVLKTMFDRVEKIYTGWQIIRFENRQRGLAIVKPASKVAGDFTAVERGTGKAVLVEVKSYKGDRFPYSALTKRRQSRIVTQADDLNEHAAAGGRSLLAWNSQAGVFIFDWPIPGFVPGKALTLEEAALLSIYLES